jgi:hypothetical protein
VLLATGKIHEFFCFCMWHVAQVRADHLPDADAMYGHAVHGCQWHVRLMYRKLWTECVNSFFSDMPASYKHVYCQKPLK